ncbi:nickel pincer cofactor biosynthesis protein LarB [Candidatus Micrarchaeota archaeon]|nr:nickel pincer cofactor biosynthesis protein LarB [Candidatus Micrarchaeota archaeon]
MRNKKKKLPYEDLFFSKVDLARERIKGFPEVIFCQGKTIEQIISIMRALARNKQNIMATRASEQIFNIVKKEFETAKYNTHAKIITVRNKAIKRKNGKILIMSAGTADIPIAEEAAVTAEFMGNRVERIYDVGVAGLHRLLRNLKKIRNASAIVVVAGMEGALPSVVSGLTIKPVIAVPTRIGYGAHFNGIAPLLTMLNSCSPGIAVVNINNGFGAGYFASIISR